MPEHSSSGEGLMEASGVCNTLNSATSSVDDSNQVNDPVEWEFDWDFDDDIMSWEWESTTNEVIGVDIKKQDEMIAWLLS